MTAPCRTCAWWGGERADDAVGTCRAAAPTMTRNQLIPEPVPVMLNRGDWLWTAADDWCGSHVAKEPAA